MSGKKNKKASAKNKTADTEFYADKNTAITESVSPSSDGQATAKVPLKQKVLGYLKSCPKRYFITAFSGMAIGLFCTLIAGTILQNFALIFKSWAAPVYDFLFSTGALAKVLMGAGIGAGIAYALKAPKMVIAGAIVAGFIGAYASVLRQGVAADGFLNSFSGLMAKGSPGNPVNSYLCALVAVELGILLSGKTKLDILVIPLVCIISAGLVAISLGYPIDWLITKIGEGINSATNAQPFLMSIIISVVMGLLLTLPTSSAAIGVSISLSGVAAGAAVAGCCAHMVGFAVASFRENKWGGLVSQGLGTSMLQIPNITRKPSLLVPAVIASIVTGPFAILFGLQCDPAGSGMGTSGLVGVINTITESIKVGVAGWKIALGIILCCFVLPAAIALLVSELMRKKGWIKPGDLKIEQ